MHPIKPTKNNKSVFIFNIYTYIFRKSKKPQKAAANKIKRKRKRKGCKNQKGKISHWLKLFRQGPCLGHL